ncbi:MAG: esterase [Anaerolineales bacterium]|nr:esterase [Anaerolineales bacterium]
MKAERQLFLQTIKGAVPFIDEGIFLPHEHLFTDLRGPSVPDYATAVPDDVVQSMQPILLEARAAGVTALVECSTIGVGRNLQILQILSEITLIHIIAPTGIYREAFVPESQRTWTPEAFADGWAKELTVGMEGTGAKAGFIKIAMSDDGPTPLESRLLESAAIASGKTGAAVASHTASGEVFQRQVEVCAALDFDLSRFIWVHANLETDVSIHLEAANMGVFVEFDAIGAAWQSQEMMVDYTLKLIEAGHIDKILLSHDAGWYQPGRPKGEPEGGYRGFVDIVEKFIPALKEKGVSEDEIKQLTCENPNRAFRF